jgi:hypothetical protein
MTQVGGRDPEGLGEWQTGLRIRATRPGVSLEANQMQEEIRLRLSSPRAEFLSGGSSEFEF